VNARQRWRGVGRLGWGVCVCGDVTVGGEYKLGGGVADQSGQAPLRGGTHGSRVPSSEGG